MDITAKPRRPAEGKASTRGDAKATLIWEGTALLTERGFQGTGIEEVLKRAGVPRGSFYHYFSSKQEFGEAVIDNYDEFYAKKMQRIFGNRSRSPLERIQDFVEDSMLGIEKYEFKRGCLVGNLGQEVTSLDDSFRVRLEAILRSWEAIFEQCLQDGVDCGELSSKADVTALSRFFWIGWEGAILRAKLTKTLDPLKHFANMFFCTVARVPRRVR
jgi:TetR/AcrR family transcriptional repressor of nem operon